MTTKVLVSNIAKIR